MVEDAMSDHERASCIHKDRSCALGILEHLDAFKHVFEGNVDLVCGKETINEGAFFFWDTTFDDSSLAAMENNQTFEYVLCTLSRRRYQLVESQTLPVDGRMSRVQTDYNNSLCGKNKEVHTRSLLAPEPWVGVWLRALQVCSPKFTKPPLSFSARRHALTRSKLGHPHAVRPHKYLPNYM